MSGVGPFKSPLLTLREAAGYLRVSESEMRHLRKGKSPLRVVKIGARVFARLQDLDDFIQARLENGDGNNRT